MLAASELMNKGEVSCCLVTFVWAHIDPTNKNLDLVYIIHKIRSII